MLHVVRQRLSHSSPTLAIAHVWCLIQAFVTPLLNFTIGAIRSPFTNIMSRRRHLTAKVVYDINFRRAKPGALSRERKWQDECALPPGLVCLQE